MVLSTVTLARQVQKSVVPLAGRKKLAVAGSPVRTAGSSICGEALALQTSQICSPLLKELNLTFDYSIILMRGS